MVGRLRSIDMFTSMSLAAFSGIASVGSSPTNFTATLQEASEYLEAYSPQHRRAVDEFVYQRLHDLRPTVGHLLLTLFPWKAIITTNYNRAVETGFEVAATIGFSAFEPLNLFPNSVWERPRS